MKKLISIALFTLIIIFISLATNIIIYEFIEVTNIEITNFPLLEPMEEEVFLGNQMEVHFFNMGRNDAIIIRNIDKVIIIDGGTYRESIKFINYIKNLGITHIDALIGSHNHYNHIQAHARILQNFTVEKLYYAHDLEDCKELIKCDLNDIRYTIDEINHQNKQINIMNPKDILNIGNIEIKNFGPINFETFQKQRYPQNYNSLNFILTYGNIRFFFTGDGIQENNILENFPDEDLKVDVFKLPHHGEDRIGRAFLERINPRYAIITSSINHLIGRNNITGKTLTDLESEILFFETEEHIIFSTDGVNLTYEIK